MLKYDIKRQILTCVYADPVVTDSQGYLTASFKFTPDWDNLLVTTYWSAANEPDKSYEVLYKGSDIRVPDEVLTDIDGFNLTVIGSNKLGERNVIVTTNVEHVPALKSGFPVVDPLNPTPSIWGAGLAESLEEIRKTTDGVVEKVNSAGSNGLMNIEAAQVESLNKIDTTANGFLTGIDTNGKSALNAIDSARDSSLTNIGSKEELMINGINSAGKTALANIDDAKTGALNDINGTGTANLDKINKTGESFLKNINTTGNSFLENIETTGSAKLNDVNSAGNSLLTEFNKNNNTAKQYADQSKQQAESSKTSASNAAESARSAQKEADRARSEADKAMTILDDTRITKKNAWSSQETADHIGYMASATGDIVRLDNLMGGYPLKVKTVSENPVTEMNLTVTGKNILPYPFFAQDHSTVYGITFDVLPDKRILVNGTATDGFASFTLCRNDIFKPGKTYYKKQSEWVQVAYKRKGDDKNYYISRNKFIWEKDMELFSIYIQVRPGATVKNLIIEPIIGTTADLSYEPYNKNSYACTKHFAEPTTEYEWENVFSIDGTNIVSSDVGPVSVVSKSRNIIDDVNIDNDRTFSSDTIIDKFCVDFADKNDMISCYPALGSKIKAISEIIPIQRGEGIPTPDNMREFAPFESYDLYIRGKNLIGRHHQFLFTGITTDGRLVEDGRCISVIAPIPSHTILTLSKAISDRCFVGLCRGMPTTNYDASGTRGTRLKMLNVNNDITELTFDSETYNYIILYYTRENIPCYDIQLEKGPVATNREEFSGIKYAQPFTEYDGKYGVIDWTTNRMTVTQEKRIYNGIGNVRKLEGYDTDKTAFFIINCGNYKSDPGFYGTSNLFEYAQAAVSSQYDHPGYCLNPQSTGTVYFRLDKKYGVVTVDEFKNFAKENPIEFTVPVDPYNIQLTPIDVRAIKDLNQIYSSTGATQVAGKEDLIYTITELRKATTMLGGK